MIDHHSSSVAHDLTAFNFKDCAKCFFHKVREFAAEGCNDDSCKYAKINEFVKGKGDLDDRAVHFCREHKKCHENTIVHNASSEAVVTTGSLVLSEYHRRNVVNFL
jgi:hypothetical protein